MWRGHSFKERWDNYDVFDSTSFQLCINNLIVCQWLLGYILERGALSTLSLSSIQYFVLVFVKHVYEKSSVIIPFLEPYGSIFLFPFNSSEASSLCFFQQQFLHFNPGFTLIKLCKKLIIPDLQLLFYLSFISCSKNFSWLMTQIST